LQTINVSFHEIPLGLFFFGTMILLAAKPTAIAHNRRMLGRTKPLITLAAIIFFAAKPTLVAHESRDLSAAGKFPAHATVVLLASKPTVIAERRTEVGLHRPLIAPATRS
jgi:hypothetical protein